jgi:hypothetical protein
VAAAAAGAGSDAGSDVPAESAAATSPAVAAAAPAPEQKLEQLRGQVADWQARFAGRQFLLPPYKAQSLMRSRDQYLAGNP